MKNKTFEIPLMNENIANPIFVEYENKGLETSYADRISIINKVNSSWFFDITDEVDTVGYMHKHFQNDKSSYHGYVDAYDDHIQERLIINSDNFTEVFTAIISNHQIVTLRLILDDIMSGVSLK